MDMKARYDQIFVGVNSTLGDYCKDQEYVFLEDLLKEIAQPPDHRKLLREITSDGAHFNYQGYEILGRAIAKELGGLVKKGDTVLLYGDSITAGYPYYEPVLSPGAGDKRHSFGYWIEELLEVQVVNRGISGDTTEGILSRFQRDDVKADLIIIQGGANDAIEMLTIGNPVHLIDRITSNISSIAGHAVQRGMKTILLPLLPFDPDW